MGPPFLTSHRARHHKRWHGVRPDLSWPGPIDGPTVASTPSGPASQTVAVGPDLSWPGPIDGPTVPYILSCPPSSDGSIATNKCTDPVARLALIHNCG